MPHKIVKGIICIFTISILFQAPALYSRDLSFTFIDIKKISSYDTDRIVYQQFEKTADKLNPDKTDNSLAVLMIIKDKKIYLLEDGYDNPEQVYFNKLSFNQGNQFVPNIWTNLIDGKPDYVIVTERRVEVQRNSDKDWVSKNYSEMYTGLRDRFRGRVSPRNGSPSHSRQISRFKSARVASYRALSLLLVTLSTPFSRSREPTTAT